VARKRSNGEGSISRRKDGRHTVNGKRHGVYGKTRKEVADKLARAIAANKEAAPEFVAANVTVAEFFEQYDGVARDTMKRLGYETYRDIARLHLLPPFGSKKLANLSREDVQRLYSQKRGAGLSAARVKRIHGVLSSALNTAVRWRLIEHNVCKDVSPPRVPQPEIRPLSLDEARRFLAAAEGDRYEALYVLGLTSGARWGELTGLYWSDLDLERRVMQIQRSLARGYGGFSLEEPKTKGSRRSVTLNKLAVDALLQHNEHQAVEGHLVHSEALVFTSTVGSPMNHWNFMRRSFKPLLRRAELPDTTWHAATRHTCTCILLLQGVNPKSVALQMG
jgi:integrase